MHILCGLFTCVYLYIYIYIHCDIHICHMCVLQVIWKCLHHGSCHEMFLAQDLSFIFDQLCGLGVLFKAYHHRSSGLYQAPYFTGGRD